MKVVILADMSSVPSVYSATEVWVRWITPSEQSSIFCSSSPALHWRCPGGVSKLGCVPSSAVHAGPDGPLGAVAEAKSVHGQLSVGMATLSVTVTDCVAFRKVFCVWHSYVSSLSVGSHGRHRMKISTCFIWTIQQPAPSSALCKSATQVRHSSVAQPSAGTSHSTSMASCFS